MTLLNCKFHLERSVLTELATDMPKSCISSQGKYFITISFKAFLLVHSTHYDISTPITLPKSEKLKKWRVFFFLLLFDNHKIKVKGEYLWSRAFVVSRNHISAVEKWQKFLNQMSDFFLHTCTFLGQLNWTLVGIYPCVNTLVRFEYSNLTLMRTKTTNLRP